MEVERFVFKPLTTKESKNLGDSSFEEGIAANKMIPKGIKTGNQPEEFLNQISNQDSVQTDTQEKIQKEKEKSFIEGQEQGYSEGYQKGLIEGSEKTRNELTSEKDILNKNIDKNLNELLTRINNLNNKKLSDDAEQIKYISKIILALAKKTSNTALLQDPLHNISKTIEENFELIFEESEIVIYVNATTAETLEDRLAQLISKSSFQGQINIRINKELPTGSFDIKWQGGGIRNNLEDIWQKIENISNNLFSEGELS